MKSKQECTWWGLPGRALPPGTCVACCPPWQRGNKHITSLWLIGIRWKNQWWPEEKTVGSIPLANDGIPAEHQGGRAFLGSRQLAEDDSHHASLDHHAHDRLETKYAVWHRVTEETDKQLDPSRLRAKTRSQCQDCVAAFLKVTPPSLPVFFTLARLKHFSQLPSSPAAKLGNNKFRRNSRASALSNGNWILSNFYLFLFVCERCHLKAHYSDCLRTLLRCLPPAVADCVLGLHTCW